MHVVLIDSLTNRITDYGLLIGASGLARDMFCNS